jgi:hypothetical protein
MSWDVGTQQVQRVLHGYYASYCVGREDQEFYVVKDYYSYDHVKHKERGYSEVLSVFPGTGRKKLLFRVPLGACWLYGIDPTGKYLLYEKWIAGHIGQIWVADLGAIPVTHKLISGGMGSGPAVWLR